MTNDLAVKLDNITKVYKLYDSSQDRLKESLHPLRKKYHRDFYAVTNIDLEIKRGETVGIIGKNGSGKSTLLKIITGVITPTSGSVTVNGKVSALLELGAGFNPQLTGLENVYFNGTLMGYTKEEMDQKLDAILSFADIGNFLHQPVRSYSSGMFVRLAFAVAINVNPDLLIVDEALSVGDIRFQRKCFAKIDQFRDEGKTILFVSHGMETINTFCNRAVLLNEGVILEQGIPRHITRIFQRMMLGEDFKDPKLQGLLRGNPTPTLTSRDRAGIDEASSDASDGDLAPLRAIAAGKLENTDGTKKAEIIDFGILDETGEKVTLLETGKPYTLFSRVLAYSDLPKIHHGFPIRNIQGLILFAINSHVQEVSLTPQKRGSIQESRVDITMWLAPGNYFLSFRAGTIDETYDEIPDAIHFVVAGDCKIIAGSIVNLEAKLSINALF